MNDQELEEIAAELALGTLSLEEWQEAKHRLETDPHFARLVAYWDYRLAPLDVKDGDVVPPFGIWHRVSNRIDELAGTTETRAAFHQDRNTPDEHAGQSESDDQAATQNNTVFAALKRSRNRWRSAFAGAVALAAGFIGLQMAGVHIPFLPQAQVEDKFVAVLNPSGASPGFLIRVDVGAKQLIIERMVGQAPAGKDYELWLIEPEQAPKPIKVVGREKVQQVDFSQLQANQDSAKQLTLAISLEPEGGSPTGKVTGEVLFSGALF